MDWALGQVTRVPTRWSVFAEKFQERIVCSAASLAVLLLPPEFPLLVHRQRHGRQLGHFEFFDRARARSRLLQYSLSRVQLRQLIRHFWRFFSLEATFVHDQLAVVVVRLCHSLPAMSSVLHFINFKL